MSASIETESADEVWIPRSEAARLLGLDVRGVSRLIERGLIVSREIPGTRLKVSLGDVLELKRAGTARQAINRPR